MRFVFKILACICVLKVNAQDDCEKFKPDKFNRFNFKIVYVISSYNKFESLKSFGLESNYYLALDAKNKYFFSTGLGYYYRTLMNKSDYFSHGVGFDSKANYTTSISHQTIEVPLNFHMSILLNKTKNKSFNFFSGISVVYLIKGAINVEYTYSDYGFLTTINKPEIYNYDYFLGKVISNSNTNLFEPNNFFPSLNYKINIGFSYPLTKHTNIGTEFNYFAKKIGTKFSSNNSVNNRYIFDSRYFNLSLFIDLNF